MRRKAIDRTINRASPTSITRSRPAKVKLLAVDRIRPEEGLSRKRDRDGHLELCRSIERFGVLTPIAVRRAPDGSGDYLLVKGQGRTLACRTLGTSHIPAILLDGSVDETEKVQQFLVENVARLRMRPIDRALLIAHARASGEETGDIARRFALSATTVRRLEAQIDGATPSEIAALRRGDVTLALHGVVSRFIPALERDEAIQALRGQRVGAKDVHDLLLALDWRSLVKLGPVHRESRVAVLRWALATFAVLPKGSNAQEKLKELAAQFPSEVRESKCSARVAT